MSLCLSEFRSGRRSVGALSLSDFIDAPEFLRAYDLETQGGANLQVFAHLY